MHVAEQFINDLNLYQKTEPLNIVFKNLCTFFTQFLIILCQKANDNVCVNEIKISSQPPTPTLPLFSAC